MSTSTKGQIFPSTRVSSSLFEREQILRGFRRTFSNEKLCAFASFRYRFASTFTRLFSKFAFRQKSLLPSNSSPSHHAESLVNSVLEYFQRREGKEKKKKKIARGFATKSESSFRASSKARPFRKNFVVGDA